MKNGAIRNLSKECLSDSWGTLSRCQFEYQREDGRWESQTREVYDRGDGVAVLLYQPAARKVILTRQFRLPTYLNGNDDGMMVEACAGVLEEASAEAAMMREIEEETGYRVPQLDYVLTTYTSPGSVSEKLHLFTAAYTAAMRVGEGGGADSETENIEVLEWDFDRAMNAISNGEIRDAKTLILLQHVALHLFPSAQ